MRPKSEIRRFIETNMPRWRRTGQRYRYRRESLGLTCTHVAEQLGISRSTLAKFENGEPMHNYDRTAVTYATLLSFEHYKQVFTATLISLLPEKSIEDLTH